MKKLVEETSDRGLEMLLGEKVLLMCSSYFYTGKLIGVHDTFVRLEDPSIVYNTGTWTNETWETVETMGVPSWDVMRRAIESYGKVNK